MARLSGVAEVETGVGEGAKTFAGAGGGAGECAGVGEAGADSTTNESVRLVSDLLVRSPLPLPLSSAPAPDPVPVPASMELHSLDSPILLPPTQRSFLFCRYGYLLVTEGKLKSAFVVVNYYDIKD